MARSFKKGDGSPAQSGNRSFGALEYDGILAMLEEKADGGRVTPSEIAAVRCVLESCAAELDDVWAEA